MKYEFEKKNCSIIHTVEWFEKLVTYCVLIKYIHEFLKGKLILINNNILVIKLLA